MSTTGGIMMIFTIGYEGRNIQEFIDILQSSKIGIVVDVRELPLSRKKGFSRSQLSAYLNEAGIRYVNLKELGTPRHLRKMLREKLISWKNFVDLFTDHLKQHLDDVRKIVDMNHSQNVCLMCYEKDYTKCHRSLIAKTIESLFGERVIHL